MKIYKLLLVAVIVFVSRTNAQEISPDLFGQKHW
jgi:hypothetical protein